MTLLAAWRIFRHRPGCWTIARRFQPEGPLLCVHHTKTHAEAVKKWIEMTEGGTGAPAHDLHRAD